MAPRSHELAEVYGSFRYLGQKLHRDESALEIFYVFSVSLTHSLIRSFPAWLLWR